MSIDFILDDLDDEIPENKKFIEVAAVIMSLINDLSKESHNQRKYHDEQLSKYNPKEEESYDTRHMNSIIEKLISEFKKLQMEKDSGEQKYDKRQIYRNISKRLALAVGNHMNMEDEHKDKIKKIFGNQLKLVDPSITDEKIDDIIALGNYDAFKTSKRFIKAVEMQQYIENRHNEIIKLYKSLEETKNLFLVLNVIINEQSEKINKIEENIQTAKTDVEIGKEQLENKAIGKKNRKCMVL